jgi:hypothetical protein
MSPGVGLDGFGEEKDLLPLPGIEQGFLSFEFCSP